MSIVRHLPPHLPRHLVQPDRVGLPYVEGGIPATLGLDLLNTSLGTYTCSTEAFRQTSATTGDWAAVDTRRIVDFGDAMGQALLLEGANTQLMAAPRDITAGTWAAGTSSTPTANAAAGPDGASLADQQDTSSGGFGNYFTIGAVSGYYTASMWARNVSGTTKIHMALQNGAGGTGDYSSQDATTSWARYSATYNCSGGVTSYWVPSEGRTLGGLTAQAQNTYQDLHMVEAGAFASTPIRTASGTRGGNFLAYAAGLYPAGIMTRGFRFTFAPLGSSTQVVNHANTVAFMTLMGCSSESSYIYMGRSGANCILSLLQAGVAKVTTGAITFSANQPITITANALAGTITIAGATTGNGTTTGTSWTWPTADSLQFARTHINSAFAWGRFGRYVAPL